MINIIVIRGRFTIKFIQIREKNSLKIKEKGKVSAWQLSQNKELKETFHYHTLKTCPNGSHSTTHTLSSFCCIKFPLHSSIRSSLQQQPPLLISMAITLLLSIPLLPLYTLQ